MSWSNKTCGLFVVYDDNLPSPLSHKPLELTPQTPEVSNKNDSTTV